MNVYDWDNTIYRGDSTFGFVRWLYVHYPKTLLSIPRTALYGFLYGVRAVKKLTFKEYDYKPVRYTQQEAAELAKSKCERYERNFLSEYKIKNKDVKTVCGEKSVKIEVTYKLYGNICEESAFFIAK